MELRKMDACQWSQIYSFSIMSGSTVSCFENNTIKPWKLVYDTPSNESIFFVDIFQLLIYHICYINFLSLILPPDMPGTVNVAPINSKINKKAL